jgi:hypothetical protein
MKPYIIFLFLLSYHVIAVAQEQDSIVSRTILIGDAGEVDSAQVRVLRSAAAHVLSGKTTVLFLGDNVYPTGMALPGTPEEQHTQAILRSQFEPMRANDAKVYFLPGNHDWDRSGSAGLIKQQAAWKFIRDQRDSGLTLLPPNGCPDPQEIALSPDLTIIVFDSEWWLFPFEKTSKAAGCSCNTATEVLAAFDRIRRRNSGKVILLASHHPFQSYGNHGGHFTLMQHLFPLREINRALFVPLPVIGSLFVLARTIFPAKEDLRHPAYKRMIDRTDSVFGGYKNLIHIAGHEHGLQFIARDGKYQVVSGSGAKHSHVVKGMYAQYADASSGYVLADQLADKNMRFVYYKVTDTGVIETFTFLKRYIR